MNDFDRKKFVFHETFTNVNGKTSGSGFIGVILGLIACAIFVATTIGYFLQIPNTLEVMDMSLKLIIAISLLLGVRKISGNLIKNGNGNGNGDSKNGIVMGAITPEEKG